MTDLPTVFVSHGAPTLIVDPCPARDFLAGLGAALPRPAAVACISAHWESEAPTVATTAAPPTIHDFFGFPPPLYDLRYPAPGAPNVASRVMDLLGSAGYAVVAERARGLDHGAWVPLKLMYPRADIPAFQLSVQAHRGPDHHLAVGRALAPLRREGVLVMASGGATHNLMEFHGQPVDAPAAPHVTAFDAWLAETIEAGDEAALLNYRRRAPDAERVHPRDEHFLPLFVALGAAGPGGHGRRIHHSFTHAVLSMAAFLFE